MAKVVNHFVPLKDRAPDRRVAHTEEQIKKRDEALARNTPLSHPAHPSKYSSPKVSMHSAMHKAAEEMRLEGKGSSDPVYENSHKNK
jgi:hypothetical protein